MSSGKCSYAELSFPNVVTFAPGGGDGGGDGGGVVCSAKSYCSIQILVDGQIVKYADTDSRT